jgi:hypothetical protein
MSINEEFCRKAKAILEDELKANKQEWPAFRDSTRKLQFEAAEPDKLALNRVVMDVDIARKDEGGHAIFMYNLIKKHCQGIVDVDESTMDGIEY